jgi:UrcA family protein
MITNTRIKLCAAIYCTLGAVGNLLLSPADAAEQNPPTKIVKYGDLDLAKADGVQVLYRRIQAAAKEVCPVPNSMDLHMQTLQQACIGHAIDEAVKSVNVVALTELRFGTPVRLASK